MGSVSINIIKNQVHRPQSSLLSLGLPPEAWACWFAGTCTAGASEDVHQDLDGLPGSPASPTPEGLAAGEWWVTARSGDFTISPPGPWGGRTSSSPSPSPPPLFQTQCKDCFGVPTNFWEGHMSLSDPSSLDLCLCPGAHSPITWSSSRIETRRATYK